MSKRAFICISGLMASFLLFIIVFATLAGPASLSLPSNVYAQGESLHIRDVDPASTALVETEWDDFDSHKWIAESWANEISANIVAFAGRRVLQADITFNNENWALLRTDSFPPEDWTGFAGLRADIYQIGGNPNSIVKLEVRDPAFDPPIQSIPCSPIPANRWTTCEWSFNLASYDYSSVSSLSLVFDNIYATSPTFYVDNLRLFTATSEEEWDDMDDESRWWFYFGNWDNWNPSALFGLEPISHNGINPTTPAGAAYLKWDYLSGIGTTAELGTRGPDEKLPLGTGDDTLDEDWSDVQKISAEVKITDPNAPISVHLWDEDERKGFLTEAKPAGATSWISMTWDVLWPADFNRQNVDEVKFVVNNIDVHTAGELYIDNVKLHKEAGSQPVEGWTTMVYLNGDNDLDGWTASAFNRLEQAVYEDNALIIFVLWDRGDDGDSNLYRVQPDAHSLDFADYVEGETKWHKGELNMGDPNTLIEFIRTVREKKFTEHSWLSIVNHGGGWSPDLKSPQANAERYAFGGSGFSWDVTDGYSYLSTKDMGTVFSHPSLVQWPIDVVFYDACLMSMVEEAYEIRHGADFFVASENETWTSFPYAEYVRDIQHRTPMTQAVWIVDRYNASLSSSGYPRTMAAIDLRKIDSLNEHLNLLAGQLTEDLAFKTERIARVFLATQKFDYDSDLLISDTDGFVDLGDLAKNLASEFVGTSIEVTANEIVGALQNTTDPIVITETHHSGYSIWTDDVIDLDDATGLSIYLPFGEQDEVEFCFYNEDELAWARDTYWNEFIREYRLREDPNFCPESPGPSVSGGRGNQPRPLSELFVALPVVMRP